MLLSLASLPDVESLLRAVQRVAKYDTSGDGGEMFFHRHCLKHGLLMPPPQRTSHTIATTATAAVTTAGSDGDDLIAGGGGLYSEASIIDGTATTTTVLLPSSSAQFTAASMMHDVNDTELFYAALIDTCAAGRHASAAMAYYEDARDRVLGLNAFPNSNNTTGTVSSSPSSSSSSSSPSSSSSSATGPTAAAAVAAVGGEEGVAQDGIERQQQQQQQQRLSATASLSEYVLYRLLAVLRETRDNRRIVQLARLVLSNGTSGNSERKKRSGDGPAATSHYSDLSSASHDPTTTAAYGSNSAATAAAAAAIGISVWSVFLISAGEARAADVALAAFYYAREKLMRYGGSVGGGDSSVVAVGSSSLNDRRSSEYLLQTALNALSKCQLTRYEADYLRPSDEAGLVHCTRDFYFCCLLQDAHNSLNPAERAADILSRMAEEQEYHNTHDSDNCGGGGRGGRELSLSPVIYSRLLKLYLRCESPLFLPCYVGAVAACEVSRVQPKAAWLDELIVWADRRRYFLTQEDREYILGQVRRQQQRRHRRNSNTDSNEGIDNTNSTTSTSATATVAAAGWTSMGGLRTQLALLAYDYDVQPLAYSASHGGAAPPTAPTVLDSRVHFVLKRPQRLRQGISGGGVGGANTNISTTTGNTDADTGCADASFNSCSSVVKGSGGRVPASFMVLGDPSRTAALARKAAIAGVAPLLFVDCGSGGGSAGHSNTNQSQPGGVSSFSSSSSSSFSSSLWMDDAEAATSAAAEAEWRGESMRVYLGEMLQGMQRSCNHIS